MKENKLPTIIAVAFLLCSVALGVLLVESKKIFRLRAMAGADPKYINISNITDRSFTVSWVTEKESTGQVVWGRSAHKLNNINISSIPYPNYTHSVIITNLEPNTTYYFKINSNGKIFDSNGIPWKTSTGAVLSNFSQANPISGIVTTKSGMPVSYAIVYVVVGGGSTLSTITERDGSWYLIASNSRNQDTASYVPIDNNTSVEISVFSGPFGIASAKGTIASAKPLPSIRLGETYNHY